MIKSIKANRQKPLHPCELCYCVRKVFITKQFVMA